jgi:hypothetical protein
MKANEECEWTSGCNYLCKDFSNAWPVSCFKCMEIFIYEGDHDFEYYWGKIKSDFSRSLYKDAHFILRKLIERERNK